MQEAIAQKRQDEESEIGYCENAGDFTEDWRKVAESNSRSMDEMMRMVGRPLNMQCRDLPK
jgi:hypothetical protein